MSKKIKIFVLNRKQYMQIRKMVRSSFVYVKNDNIF